MSWECARAAVENGADAIYFLASTGLTRGCGRNNFTEADLPRLMEFLHRRGVKGYVTFNTLVFEDEMAAAEQYLRTSHRGRVSMRRLCKTWGYAGSSEKFRRISRFTLQPK